MGYVQKLVTQDSFDARGVFVSAGHVGLFDEERLNGDEKHIKDVGDFQEAVVEIAAIGPTGPNPTAPQQLPPDAVQTPGGGYATPGKRLVGEVTKDASVRLEDSGIADRKAEDKVNEALGDIMDTDASASTAARVDGTVAEVTRDLGGRTDEELNALKAAENDREGGARVGVLKAIDAELDGRKAS